jgi:hypothetical protein
MRSAAKRSAPPPPPPPPAHLACSLEVHHVLVRLRLSVDARLCALNRQRKAVYHYKGVVLHLALKKTHHLRAGGGGGARGQGACSSKGRGVSVYVRSDCGEAALRRSALYVAFTHIGLMLLDRLQAAAAL